MIEAVVREGASALEIQEALDKEDNAVKHRIVREGNSYRIEEVKE